MYIVVILNLASGNSPIISHFTHKSSQDVTLNCQLFERMSFSKVWSLHWHKFARALATSIYEALTISFEYYESSWKFVARFDAKFLSLQTVKINSVFGNLMLELCIPIPIRKTSSSNVQKLQYHNFEMSSYYLIMKIKENDKFNKKRKKGSDFVLTCSLKIMTWFYFNLFQFNERN